MADTIDNDEDGVWLYCSNSAIRRAARQLGQLYDDAIGDSGLKGTQFSLLSQIRLLRTPSLKTLANAMVMDLSALGQTLKPLLGDGLVELVPDEHDRRVKRVRLTPVGTAKQTEVAEGWKEAQRRFDQVFGEDRSAELRRTLALISSPDFANAFGKADSDPS